MPRLITALAIILVAIGVTIRLSSASGDARTIRFGVHFPAEHGPFLTGQQVSLAEAMRSFPSPVYRPQSTLASDDTISKVWIEKAPGHNGGSQCALYYSSGVQVFLRTLAGTFDAQTVFVGAANQLHLWDGVQTVHNGPGLVIPAAPDHLGSASFAFHGVEVTVYGNLSTDQLKYIADSVRA